MACLCDTLCASRQRPSCRPTRSQPCSTRMLLSLPPGRVWKTSWCAAPTSSKREMRAARFLAAAAAAHARTLDRSLAHAHTHRRIMHIGIHETLIRCRDLILTGAIWWAGRGADTTRAPVGAPSRAGLSSFLPLHSTFLGSPLPARTLARLPLAPWRADSEVVCSLAYMSAVWHACDHGDGRRRKAWQGMERRIPGA